MDDIPAWASLCASGNQSMSDVCQIALGQSSTGTSANVEPTFSSSDVLHSSVPMNSFEAASLWQVCNWGQTEEAQDSPFGTSAPM